MPGTENKIQWDSRELQVVLGQNMYHFIPATPRRHNIFNFIKL